MARAVETEEKPPRMTLLSALAAFFLIGGAAVLGVFGSGAYDKMTGATSRSMGPAGPISYTQVSDALVSANTIKPVVTSNKTAVPVDALPSDAVTIPSWRAVEDSKGGTESGGVLKPKAVDDDDDESLGTGAVCYPKNGYEVVRMVNGTASPCRVIVLTRPFTYGYKIERQINVTQPKIIVGNPIAMPMINCSKKIERCFEVLPGGRLDTRFLIMVRGGGRYLDPGKRRNLNFGTHVRVFPGGDFTATGVLFRERNNTLASFFNELENTMSLGGDYLNFNLGQYISVIGGNLFLQGCLFTRIRPYGTGYLTTFSLGREVLVIAGNAVFTGVNNIAYMLFSSYPYVSGKVLCVMGGTATMIGGSSVYATGAQLQLGWGIDLTTLGGVLVTIGWQYSASNAALLRLGGGQFGVGGGTVYHTGLNYMRAIGAGALFGAGVTHVNGGGSLTYIGGSYASFLITCIFAGIGGWVFQGSGSSTFIAVPQSRYAVSYNVYGSGGVFYMGAGILTLIANPQYNAYTVYYQVGAASDTFMGVGWLTSIRNIRWQFQVLYGHIGIGTHVYIGAGAAIFINTYSYYKRLKYWRNWDYTYTVGGMGYKVKPPMHTKEVLKITKDKATVEYYDKGKGSWTYKVYKKYSSGSGGYARMLQEAAEWLEQAVTANGGLNPENNKIVMLNSTNYESRGDGRFPTQAEFQVQNTKGTGSLSYGKLLAQQAYEDPYPAVTKDSVQAGTIAVKNASCFVCGLKPGTTADHVPPGSPCEVQEGCAGTTARETLDAANAKTEQELGFPGRDFIPSAGSMASPAEELRGDLPDLHFLWYDMTVYCRSTNTEVDDATIMEDCLSADYVKRIVRAYLELDGLDQGYDMTVSPMAVHSAVKSVLGADDPVLLDLQMAMVPAWNPDCQGHTKYELQFSTQHPAIKSQIAKIMNGVVADPDEMSENIVQNADTTEELQPCSITLAKKADTRFPSIGNMPPFQPSSRSKVGPDVVVSDGRSIVPADEVVPGQTYQIWVQNFPKNSNVNIQLVSGNQNTGPIIATLEDFEDDGVSDVITWTAPAALDPTQRYYLRASAANVPALFANSQILRGRRG